MKKTDEEAMTEWALDEINFDCGMTPYRDRHGPFTREEFEEICRSMKTDSSSLPLQQENLLRTAQLREEAITAMRASGWDDAKILGWLEAFFSPRNIIRYWDVADVNAKLRIMCYLEKERLGFSPVPSLEDIRKKK